MTQNDASVDVAVIGAGAAGLMAAIFAARGGADTLLVERTRDGGRKILISGGGRCNVLPSQASPKQFFTASSPNTLAKMLRSWPLREQRAFFEDDLGLPLALEPESGKLFPASNRARDVRDALVAAVRSAGGRIAFDTLVARLEPPDETGGWRISLGDGAELRARAVVLASGGLSVPKTGSDGIGLRIAAALGHEMHPTYAALTPLVAEPPPHAELAGVSLEVALRAPRRLDAAGGFLFTHRGYSGPSVLNISHLAVLSPARGEHRQEIEVQWAPLGEQEWDERLLYRGDGGAVLTRLRRHLPARLADVLLREAEIPAGRLLSQLRRDERTRLVRLLTRYPLPWTGDEGYKKAEVTGGGVALDQVDPRTLESRRHPCLFLCGEILDAFGPIGGYNFMWAWATGRAAGIAAAAAAAAVESSSPLSPLVGERGRG